MKRPPVYTLGILAVCVALLFALVSPAKSHSVEVGFTSLSPSGIAGGQIVPASCNGAANASDYGASCSASNACGTNTSTYDTCGNCPATPPSCTPPTVTVLPTTVLVGKTATVTWSCPSPNTSSTNSFSGATAVSGSATVTVTNTTTYTVRCAQTGAQASATVTAVNPTISLVATPSRVNSGSASSLTWSASSVSSCTLTGPGVSASATADSGGNISSRSTATAPITAQSTFTLQCQTSGGPVSSSVNVTLIPVVIEI